MIYINTRTNEFPLFIGDIPFHEIGWEEGQPVPDYFQEVEVEPIPIASENQVHESRQPELVDGRWIQKHFIRVLSQEEIDASNARKEAEKQRLLDAGLKPLERPVILDENGNIIFDVYGNMVEPTE